jgi:hypothetical protein
LATVIGLGILVWLDQSNLERGLIGSGDRIVDRQAIIALIGATTVQIGAIAVVIARYLFPGQPTTRTP